MKKILILSFVLVVFLAACSADTTKDTNNTSSVDENTTTNSRMPDFERPDEDANIRGLVKSIVGNEVTILEVIRPERPEGDDEGAAPTIGLNTTGTRIPGMGGGGGTRSTDVDARIDMLKSMSTGEKKVLIPVGIRMLKNVDGEMVEATLVDVTSDKMLVIWTNDSVTDRNVAEFVIIN